MEYLSVPMVTPTGFREYDARWRYPEQVNLAGIQSLGLAFATQLHEMGVTPKVALGCDFRSYSAAIKQAFALGLVSGGAEVLDIGVGLSPMAYFSQFDLDAPAVAMVTASHNPNGWTGVKIGCERPLTHGPAEMGRLKEIVMQGQGVLRGGGSYRRVEGVRERYIADLIGGFRMSRPLKVVVACGNGAAGAFGPAALEAIGVEVVPLHTD
ncbi:MAG: phosphomannomutase/phosphoglucomutase, partial [Pseudomonadota bacterium]